MIWSAVCLVAPYPQLENGARPHLGIDEQKHPSNLRTYAVEFELKQDALDKPITHRFGADPGYENMDC